MVAIVAPATVVVVIQAEALEEVLLLVGAVMVTMVPIAALRMGGGSSRTRTASHGKGNRDSRISRLEALVDQRGGRIIASKGYRSTSEGLTLDQGSVRAINLSSVSTFSLGLIVGDSSMEEEDMRGGVHGRGLLVHPVTRFPRRCRRRC